MTEFESRHKGTKTVTVVLLIALVVGIGGGWLIGAFTSGSSESPGSVYAARADGGSLVGGLLTLKAVGNSVVKVDSNTKEAQPSDAAAFFSGWNDTFGSGARSAVVTGTTPDGEVQLVLELTNASFSEIGYVVEFDADVVSGPAEVRGLTNVTLLIDGD